ncbi:ABC transporter ATP-binding protein [Mameliella alba]|nr:ABC transporter ATP-binding protein [Mameliella alba]MBY6170264.1 ABC transporter ATP-binding protein [Mameliella alba]MBY6175283.1 ABC transporter ATP-binding protein [Mameliella alba]
MTGSMHIEEAVSASSSPLLEVSDLAIGPRGADQPPLVSDVSLRLMPGQTMGIVGESGSGKSLTCLAILDLLPPALCRTSGSVRFKGQQDAIAAARGKHAAMVFQDPFAALNPMRRVGRFLTDLLRLHRGLTGRAAEAEAIRLLDAMGIPGAARRMKSYPHELSGGQNQRVLIAGALAGRPSLLIADEPTTALDVTTQSDILDLLKSLCREQDMGLLIVSHDFGVIAETVQDVAVMYAGRIVERAPVAQLFAAPAHPYTRALLGSIPPEHGAAPLAPLPGQAPAFAVAGRNACALADRCAHTTETCRQMRPEPHRRGAHDVFCHMGFA